LADRRAAPTRAQSYGTFLASILQQAGVDAATASQPGAGPFTALE
jgi:hypothetical protein